MYRRGKEALGDSTRSLTLTESDSIVSILQLREASKRLANILDLRLMSDVQDKRSGCRV